MNKVLILIILISNILFAYTDSDWKVFNACKERVYDNKNNSYDYVACKEMLEHKDTLRKYGAESSYNYWLKQLGKQ